MKKSLKTFVAVLATLLPLVLTGCNQLSSLDENARQAYENKKKIQALASSFEEDATEEEKAKRYAKLAASIAGLKVDKEYKLTTKYDNENFTEIFEITSEGKAKYGGYVDTLGNIVALLVPPDEYSGIIIIIKSDNHYNYGKYQYPSYSEENPHSGCYMGFYLKDNGSSFSEAGTTWKVPKKEWTACAESFEYLEELFDKYGYAATCAAYSTEFPK